MAFQYILDGGDPYLTSSQRNGRLLVTSAGAGVSSGIGAAVAFGLTFLGATTPVGWIGGAVALGVSQIWYNFIQPTIFDNAGLNPVKTLQPFSP